MRHDRGDSLVEFFDSEPGDDPDEDLAPHAGFPRLRRARLPLLVAGVVALVALVAVDVASGPKNIPSAAAPTTASAESRNPAASHLPPVTCPVGASCAVVTHTPTRVAAAIRHALPAVTDLRTITTLAHEDAPGSHLFSRLITARLGPARLRIEVGEPGAHDLLGFNASETPARTLVTVRDHLGGRLVSLHFVTTPGKDPDFQTLRTLARDRQLTAPASGP